MATEKEMIQTEELSHQLKQDALAMGAAYFGIADLSLTRQGPLTPIEQKLATKYTTAVIIGVPLDTSIVEKIGNQDDTTANITHTFITKLAPSSTK